MWNSRRYSPSVASSERASLLKSREIVILSGKGGTGKTSLTASLGALAHRDGVKTVLTDCDVDAADLHVVLQPTVLQRHDFVSGETAHLNTDKCTHCGKCAELCRFDAVSSVTAPTAPKAKGHSDSNQMELQRQLTFSINGTRCEGCGLCKELCPSYAINMAPRWCGEWFISDTRIGRLIHAKLGIGAENSGKLVSTLRKEAQAQANQMEADPENRVLLLSDGPPGIGCPVIASVTGADTVLIITEPTLSGEHDLERVIKLAAHFRLDVLLCINKWDINPDLGAKLINTARDAGAELIGRIPWDITLGKAQAKGISVVEHAPYSPASLAIQSIWERICQKIL